MTEDMEEFGWDDPPGQPRIAAVEAAEMPSVPCAPGSNWYKPGDKLRIASIEWGHVFVYRDGPDAPGIQCPLCIGCGRPFHIVRDEQEGKQS